MSDLMSKMMSIGSVSGASIMADSVFFTKQDMVTTSLPILNIAFSGELDGGMTPGLTVIAGESKSFKSALSLFCMKAYMDKYPKAIAIFYDTEFGITNDYLKTFGIDPKRVLHIPVEHIEQLKFDIMKKLESIKRGDKIFFLVDSIGQISSKKEVDDTNDEKSVTDMTRAKSLRSMLKLVTIQLTKKDIPCIMVNHVYKTQEMYAKTVIPGGTAVMYSSNQIFVISRSQEKDGDELTGYKFTITIEKSRFIREKSKLPLNVSFTNGISKWSGLFDLALESGHITKPKVGWYHMTDDDGVIITTKSIRQADLNCDEYLGQIIKRQSFKDFIIKKYKLVYTKVDGIEESQNIADTLSDDEEDAE